MRLDERFLADLQQHWEIHGKSAIQQLSSSKDGGADHRNSHYGQQ